MRRPIEQLADKIVSEGWLNKKNATVGDIADHFNEDVLRVADALDVVKIKAGQTSYISMVSEEQHG